MENTKELEYNYVGYAGIGKRDSKDDILDSLNQEGSQPSSEETYTKPNNLTESFDEDDVDTKLQKELAWHKFDSEKFMSAGHIFEDAAKNGVSHHEILSATKHLPKIDHPADSELHNILSSAPNITPDIHHHVFETLAKVHNEGSFGNNHSAPLTHKYGWVLHHGVPEEAPEHHINDYSLNHDDIKKAASLGLMFTNGRHVRIPGGGNHAFMNRHGKFEAVVEHTHHDVKIPEMNQHNLTKENSLYEINDELEKHYANLHHNANLEHIRTYTEDSVAINKSAAHINMGKPDPLSDGDFHDDKVAAISKAIKHSPALSRDIHVYTGLSRSTDPSKSESKDGKKTTYLPAFTSTSLQSGLSTDFAKGKRDSEETYGTHPEQPIRDILHMKIPAGSKHGIYVNGVSENTGEHEFILNHGSVVRHDAEPTITASHGKLLRIWKNGEVLGQKQHSEWGVRQAITDPMTAEKHYFGTIRHSVKVKALTNKMASDKMLDHATKSDDEHLTKAAIKNPNLQPEHIDNISNSLVPEHIKAIAITHKNATEKNLTNAINENKGNFHVAMAVADHPKLKEEHIDKLLKYSTSSMTREKIAKNPATPDHVLHKFANSEDPSDIVASIVARNRLGITESEIQKYVAKVTELLKG